MRKAPLIIGAGLALAGIIWLAREARAEPAKAWVKIGAKAWVVDVARTSAQIAEGLRGIESIPVNTGMLFDLGEPTNPVEMDTSGMLFPTDFVFIAEDLVVLAGLWYIHPDTVTSADFTGYEYPRYHLQVNAGEAWGIARGDSVVIAW